MTQIVQIHKCRYEAFTFHNNLIVHRTGKTTGGKYLTGDSAKTWTDAIKTAIDNSEADALCRAILA